MSSSPAEPHAPAAPLLGEAIEEAIFGVLLHSPFRDPGMNARAVRARLEPLIAALVAEQREAERERCSSELLEFASRPSADTGALIPAWLRTEMREIARRWAS